MNDNVKFSRRWFIGGAAAFGAFGGCRFLEKPFGLADGKPRLRFGVVSDIHFVMDEGLIHYPNHGDELFLRALRHYRDCGVDAVMVCGDLADRSIGEEILAIGKAFDQVFPDGRAPDGHKVEKLFVNGNHDWEGHTYGHHLRRIFPDPVAREQHIFRNNMPLWWDRAFHEEFKPVWMKEVNGYTFIGAHWHDTKGSEFNPHLAGFYEKNGKLIDPALPFFHIQHPPPKDTIFDNWGWGQDGGTSTKILSKYPNAVAFSGHSHNSIADPRFIWQGAFTSVCAGSLCGVGLANEEFDGKGGMFFPRSWPSAAQGQIWSVYDDRIEIERHDYRADRPLGATLTMPLPAAEPKPFAYAEHAKRLRAPEFSGKYAVVLEPEGKTHMKILIPAVVPDTSAQCYYYEMVCVSGNDKDGKGKKVMKRIAARNAMLSQSDPHACENTIISFPLKDLPPEPIVATVTPVGYLGKRGKPLSAVFTQAKWQPPAT